MFAGILSRRRQVFESISLGEAGVGFAAWALELVITPLLLLMPGYKLDSQLRLLQAGGLVKLVLGIKRVDGARLGKTMLTLLLVLQINRFAAEKHGATLMPRNKFATSDPRRFLNAALSPTTRRLARRALAELGRSLGLDAVCVDFAAMYRTGSMPAVRFVGPAGAGVRSLPASRDGLVFLLLAALVFACDCWALQENPVNVAFAALIQHGTRLWESGSPEFRTAMTEALVLATCQTLPREKVERLDRMEAVAVLEGDVLDWASSVVIAFHELRGHSLSRFRLMRFLRDLTNRAKLRSGDLELLDLHLLRLGHRVVNVDRDNARDLADDRADPGRVIPNLHELRARLQLGRLTSRERHVLALRMQDLPFNEIARELDISPATARVLMHRVRRATGHGSAPKHQRRR